MIERTSTTTSVDWDCVIVIERTSTTTSKDQKSKTGRPKISIKSGLVRDSRIKKVYSQGKVRIILKFKGSVRATVSEE